MDSNDDVTPSTPVGEPASQVVTRRGGWPRVAGFFILSAAATVTAIFTDAQTAIGVILPLVPYLPGR